MEHVGEHPPVGCESWGLAGWSGSGHTDGGCESGTMPTTASHLQLLPIPRAFPSRSYVTTTVSARYWQPLIPWLLPTCNKDSERVQESVAGSDTVGKIVIRSHGRLPWPDRL
jgi:hypothetical protein